MSLKFSGSTKCFYDTDINPVIPEDSVDITRSMHKYILDGQSEGMIIGTDVNGFPTLENAPDPTPEEYVDMIVNAIQNFMDAQAQTRRYDSIASAISYADEDSVPKFQAEGQAFRVWRSLVWAHCYALLDEGGEPPAIGDVIAGLPELVLPE